VTYWNTVGGIGSIALGLYWFSLDLPEPLWWAPWASCVGGAFLLVSVAIRAYDRVDG
jgi:hypothetical protein